MSSPGARVLHAALDVPLPREVAVGEGTALFVAGTCFSPAGKLAALELLVDGEPHPVDAFGMPRLDYFASLHPGLDPYATGDLEADPASSEDPGLYSYRSGFWGVARLTPRPGARVRWLGLRARLEDGSVLETELAQVRTVVPEAPPEPPAWPLEAGSPKVAVCMATYNPPPDLFAAQIESIRAQTHGNWICLISDDGSGPEGMATIERVIAGDQRFLLSGGLRRLGFYGNFERALGLVPADADFVAMSDQDDQWNPDKLETLLQAIGSAQLVYSDQRVVGRRGEVLSETYWSTRTNNHSDLLSLLTANSVTGAASLLRRDLLDACLPFPPAQFHHFHDHWIALTALCRGEIEFVARPLYDYVQHGEASLGHATANQMTGLLDRLSTRSPLRDRVRMWRLHWFVDVCRLMQVVAVLELRSGEQMSARQRRELARFRRTARSLPAMLRLAARGVREMLGRPQTLGAEWMLLHAFLWRQLVAVMARDRPQRGLRVDAVPPPTLALEPARVATSAPGLELAGKIAPLELAVSADAPVRVNLLIPTLDLQHFFGGYIAKFNLAKRLATRGLRVRLLTTDPVGPLPPNWKHAIESYSGLEGLFDSVELDFGRGGSPVEVSPRDGFIATTWWTAHIAAAALRSLETSRFVYLIQEYEPFTFPMGSYAALAAESYTFEHFAVFSTELLRDYFRGHGIGAYRAGTGEGDRESLAFQNAITAVQPPTAVELGRRSSRRLLVYARPEGHAARNMFEISMLALSRALQQGVFDRRWELRGIGTLRDRRTIPLAAGVELELIPRSAQGNYAELLRGHDVGLALMYTPHPSLVPIEMASAGMVTVTNTFENKTPDALAAISANLVAAEPSIGAIAAALGEAVARVDDVEGRVAGSHVAWSRDWDETFDDALLDAISGATGCLEPVG